MIKSENDITRWSTKEIISWIKDFHKFYPYLNFAADTYKIYSKAVKELIKRIENKSL